MAAGESGLWTDPQRKEQICEVLGPMEEGRKL